MAADCCIVNVKMVDHSNEGQQESYMAAYYCIGPRRGTLIFSHIRRLGLFFFGGGGGG